MKVKNKNEVLYRIKVNKKLIQKNKENNIKILKTPTKIKDKMKLLNKKKSLPQLMKTLYNFDFDINAKKKNNQNYSQRTYTYKSSIEDSPYKKGNIIYDMQNNKYLKPILGTKDFHTKMLKCSIDESFSQLLNLNKDINYRSLSGLSSPNNKNWKIKNHKERNNINNNLYRLKKENKVNNTSLYLYNNLKDMNSNFPFFKYSLNNSKNFNCRNKDKEILNKYNSFNPNKPNIIYNNKASISCKNFYKNRINYKSQERNYNKYENNKTLSNSFKDCNINRSLYERIGNFCYILELFFFNIIKKSFVKLIKEIKSMKYNNRNENKNYYKINSEVNSKRNTFYDTDTIKSYKNYYFDNEITNLNHISNLNYFNIFDNNDIINNTNNCDRNIIEDFRDINYYINNIKKINNNNFKSFNNNIYSNNCPKNKNKLLIFRKINNSYYPSNKLIIYQKKSNFTKSIKDEKNKTNNEIRNINKSENIENTFSHCGYDDSISKQKIKIINIKHNKVKNDIYDLNMNKNKQLFMFFNYYSISDINYKKIFNKKYKNKIITHFYNRLYFNKNINFTIKNNIYKKIKIYENNKHNKNCFTFTVKKNKKTKKIFNINTAFSIHDDDIKKTNNKEIIINKNKNNNKNKDFIYKFQRKKEKINKIVINCAKLLAKILTKIYLKKKFIVFKQKIDCL